MFPQEMTWVFPKLYCIKQQMQILKKSKIEIKEKSSSFKTMLTQYTVCSVHSVHCIQCTPRKLYVRIVLKEELLFYFNFSFLLNFHLLFNIVYNSPEDSEKFLPWGQRFLSCMAFIVYEVVRVACQSLSCSVLICFISPEEEKITLPRYWKATRTTMQERNLCSQGTNLSQLIFQVVTLDFITKIYVLLMLFSTLSINNSIRSKVFWVESSAFWIMPGDLIKIIEKCINRSLPLWK